MKLDYFRKTGVDLLQPAPGPLLRLPPLDQAFLLAVLYISGTVNAPQAIALGGLWTTAMGATATFLWLTKPYFPRGTLAMFVPLTLWTIYGLLSVFWGGTSLHTWQLLAVNGGFLALALMTARECEQSPRLMATLCQAMDVASITGAVGYTLVFLIYGSAGEAYLFDRPLFLARPFALFACIAVARQLARWHAGEGGQAGFWIAVWLAAMVVLSQSRTATLITFALFPLSYIVKGQFKGIAAAIGLTAVGGAIAWAAIFLYQPLYDRMFKYDASIKVGGVAINSSGRTTMWKALWDDMQGSNWYFGKGLGASSRFIDIVFYEIGHPHNDYLRFLYDVGALGLGLYLLFMLAAISMLWGAVIRTARTRDPAIGIHMAPLLGFFALAISMATDNPVTYVYMMSPLAIMTGCSISLLQAERNRRLMD